MNQYRMQYPHLTEDQLNQATRAYMMQIQSGFTGNTAAYDKSYYQQEMQRAKMASQQMYPGVYSQARGAREAPQVTGSDLSTAANQLQQYQKLLQIQRAHAELKRQQQQQQAAKLVTLQAGGGGRPNIIRKPFVPTKPKPKSNPNAPVSVVTLDDDDDEDEEDEDDDEVVISGDDSDDGEIVLDGAPQMEDYDDQAPSTSSKRRGRPRLDPETDPV